MRREPSADDLARLAAPPPPEPKFVRRVGIGTVKWYREAKGYGAISLPEIAPWDIWFHFSAIARPMFTTLASGERAELAQDWDGSYFVATGERFVEGVVTGDGTRVTLAVGDRVEVEFYRADQESFKYIARIMRRLDSVAESRTELSLRVEQATPADLDAIRGAYANAQVMQRQQRAPEWPGFADASILAEIVDGRLYRIMDDTAIAGVFTVAYDDAAIWGDLERGAHIYLHRIARTEHRTTGRLMDAVMSWSLARCEELGREGLRIDTWAANPALQAYYGTVGFTLVATRRMGNDPRLSPHYIGLELALMERPRDARATRSPS